MLSIKPAVKLLIFVFSSFTLHYLTAYDSSHKFLEIKKKQNVKFLEDSTAPSINGYRNFYGIKLQGSEHSWGYFNSGRYKIFAQYFKNKNSKKHIILIHGYFNHAGNLSKLINFLIEKQYSILCYDMPGHGFSSGERASINSFSEYVNTLKDFISYIGPLIPPPYNIISHSTGGAATLEFILQSENDPFNSVILISPLIRSNHFLLSKIGTFLISPFLKSTLRVFRKNTSDIDYRTFISQKDPLQTKRMPIKWSKELIKWEEKIHQYLPDSKKIFIIQGTADKIVEWQYNMYFLKTKFPESKIYLINDANHELLNEAPLYKNQVFHIITKVLQK